MKSYHLWALALTLGLAGCSSASKKADYSTSTNANEEIGKLESDIDGALAKQYDVIAPKELQRSQKHLDAAKKELQKGEKLSTISADLAESREALDQANKKYEIRHGRVDDVMRARQAAIDAGAHRYARSEKELAALDDSFRVNAAGLDKARDPEIWKRTILDYKVAEAMATQEDKVGDARERIARAKKDGGNYLAPKTYKEATTALATADKAIARDPHDEAGYGDQVMAAKKAAILFAAVTAEARHASVATNEEVARELVAKDRSNGQLKGELKDAELESGLKGQALVDKEMQLRGLTTEERSLAKEKKFNDSLKAVQQEFDKDEADVYREGDKILIRLKKIGFKSGQTDIPATSLPLLAKVKNVIHELSAEDVMIEGHTDSIGAVKTNRELSQGRAQAVAEYIKPDTDAKVEAVGYGYEKPITSNKTKSGRAANRRVDVVITPAAQM